MEEKEILKPAKNNSYGEVIRNIVFVLVALGTAYFITVSIGIEGLRDTAASTGIWGILSIILLKATTIIFVPLGGSPIYVIAGASFGFLKGWILTVIGDFIGFTVSFYLSRFFGRSIINFFVPNSQVAMLESLLEKSSRLSALIKARIAFLAMPELFAYGAGLTKVSFPVFITVQMIPNLILSTVLVFFGDIIISLGSSTTYLIAASVGAIGIAIVGGWLFHRDIAKEA